LKDLQQDLVEPEKHLKTLLPTFTPDENIELLTIRKNSIEIENFISKKIGKSAGTLLDYEEALYFGDSSYASLTRYYFSLERIITMEWFMRQL